MYVLAVDGGASSTNALLADTEGNVVGWGKAGPSNHLHGEAGKRRLFNALQHSVGAALDMANEPSSGDDRTARLTADGVVCAALGMTGVRTGSQGATLVTEYVRRLLPAEHVVVSEDARTALLAATSGGPGVLVYAGTGSIGLGLGPSGVHARVGGWGYLIDDEGGAYKIGQAVLKAVYRASDGRAKRTALADKLLAHLNASSLWEAHARVYKDDGLARPEVARLATLAGEAAAEGDAVARHILANAAEELAALAAAAARSVGDDSWVPTVYPSGGVFRAGRAILDPFTAAIRRDMPGAQVGTPKYDPLVGAYIMALSALDVPPAPEALARAVRSANNLGLSLGSASE